MSFATRAGGGIEGLISLHKNRVYRQLVRACGNYDDADDALAEAIISAFRAASQLENPEYFSAWLGRIAARACSRLKIKNRLLHAISIDELGAAGIELTLPQPSLGLEAQLQLKNCVQSALAQLDDNYRAVYQMRELEQRSASEVAIELNLSIPAVKSRLHRARSQVREALESGLECTSV